MILNSSLLHAPAIRRTIRALHLSTLARPLAYHAVTRGRRHIPFTRAGTTAVFFVPTPWVWRSIDTVAAEPVLQHWLEEVHPGDVVYDVGAHFGVYSIFAARRGARVFAFEPDVVQHEVFNANVQANSLQTNITLASVALSDHDGQTVLFQGDGVGALDGVATAKQLRSQPAHVRIARADEYILPLNWPRPTVVKIDVEGYESAVLDGFGDLLEGVRVVFCEVHPHRLLPGETPQSIRDRLTNSGLVISDSQKLGNRDHVLAVRP